MERSWKRSLLVVGALLAVASGCSGTDDPTTSSTSTPATVATTKATGSYVGTVKGSDAYVALVVGPEGDALAYVCDGAESVDWLSGQLEGDAAVLQNDGGAILEATFTGGHATGTVTRPDSEPLTFAATTADRPAGLYRAEESFADGDYVGGWVVLPEGTQRGAVRRYETPLPAGIEYPLDLEHPTITVPGGTLTAYSVDP